MEVGAKRRRSSGRPNTSREQCHCRPWRPYQRQVHGRSRVRPVWEVQTSPKRPCALSRMRGFPALSPAGRPCAPARPPALMLARFALRAPAQPPSVVGRAAARRLIALSQRTYLHETNTT